MPSRLFGLGSCNCTDMTRDLVTVLIAASFQETPLESTNLIAKSDPGWGWGGDSGLQHICPRTHQIRAFLVKAFSFRKHSRSILSCPLLPTCASSYSLFGDLTLPGVGVGHLLCAALTPLQSRGEDSLLCLHHLSKPHWVQSATRVTFNQSD